MYAIRKLHVLGQVNQEPHGRQHQTDVHACAFGEAGGRSYVIAHIKLTRLSSGRRRGGPRGVGTEQTQVKQYPVAVIGAGPYGISVAAHLRSRGIPALVFGRPMAFWDRMPNGMFLKSVWSASSIADPHGLYTLDRYVATTGYQHQEPVPLPDFVEYGRWVQRNTIPDVDPALVQSLARDGDQFRVELDDGRSVAAGSVVVATGIQSFAHLPAFAHDLPSSLASHTQDHKAFSQFAGKRVAVLGRGQSAVQTAAFLHEAGASHVEVIAHGPIIWSQRKLYEMGGLVQQTFYAPSDVGPAGLTWIIHFPSIYYLFPEKLRAKIDRRATRPAGAKWLRDRVEGHVAVTAGAEVAKARPHGDELELTLTDGTTRVVDHLFAGTGYRPDIDRLTFIDPVMREQVRRAGTLPLLDTAYQSSVPGLFFVGAIAAHNFGPLTRFVAGTGVAARHITHCLSRGGDQAEMNDSEHLTSVRG
jgi:cation diffusion facilitator CzcD-associated flavoprotein CzcO